MPTAFESFVNDELPNRVATQESAQTAGYYPRYTGTAKLTTQRSPAEVAADIGAAALPIDLATDVTGLLPFANIADLATDNVLGRISAGTGVLEPVPFTDFMQTLAADATAADARDTLGLGDLAVLDSPLTVPDGGTGGQTYGANSLIFGDGTDPLKTISGIYLSGGIGTWQLEGLQNIVTLVNGSITVLGDPGDLDDVDIQPGRINGAKALLIETNAGQPLTLGPAGDLVVSTFGAGVVHSSAGGVLTSSAVDLDSAEVTGDLPYANFEPATGASLLLGRGSAAGAGDWQEITIGANLTMTGTTLSAASGGVTDHGALTGLGDDDHTQYLLASGLRALSDNWDAGSFTITALRLISDVATGTAPFSVASQTVVTNLNADMLDGLHASNFSQVGHTHDGSEIDSGVVGVAYGGTGADLSATGGATSFVRQASTGAAFTVGTIASGDLPSHTHTASQVTDFDEAAQDAVGGILTDTAEIDFTYADATPAITADIKANSVALGKIAVAGAASKLLGSGASGGGATYSEITLGTNLSMSGTTLNAAGGVTDHGALTGLADDDHTQYLLADGTRNLGGNLLATTAVELRFRDTTNRIYSPATGELNIEGNTTTRLGKIGNTGFGQASDTAGRLVYPLTDSATQTYDLGNITTPYRWNNLALYGNLYIDRDGSSSTGAIVLGDGQDAAIYYDNTNLFIDPKVVGSGYLGVLGDVHLGDDKALELGDGADMRLFWDASDLKLECAGSVGTLVFDGQSAHTIAHGFEWDDNEGWLAVTQNGSIIWSWGAGAIVSERELQIKPGNAASTYAEVGGTLAKTIADGVTSGSSETDLVALTISASSCGSNGAAVRFSACGDVASGTSGTKTFKLYIGASQILSAATAAITAARTWVVEAVIWRVTSTTYRASATLEIADSAGASTNRFAIYFAGSITWGSDAVVKITGTNTSATNGAITGRAGLLTYEADNGA